MGRLGYDQFREPRHEAAEGGFRSNPPKVDTVGIPLPLGPFRMARFE